MPWRLGFKSIRRHDARLQKRPLETSQLKLLFMTSQKMALAPHHWRTKNDVFAQPERSRLWLLLLENGIKLQSIILVLILQLLRSLMHIAYSYYPISSIETNERLWFAAHVANCATE